MAVNWPLICTASSESPELAESLHRCRCAEAPGPGKDLGDLPLDVIAWGDGATGTAARSRSSCRSRSTPESGVILREDALKDVEPFFIGQPMTQDRGGRRHPPQGVPSISTRRWPFSSWMRTAKCGYRASAGPLPRPASGYESMGPGAMHPQPLVLKWQIESAQVGGHEVGRGIEQPRCSQ